jgi:hypothetical protein
MVRMPPTVIFLHRGEVPVNAVVGHYNCLINFKQPSET